MDTASSRELIKVWFSMGLMAVAAALWAVLEFLQGHLWRAVISAAIMGVCIWIAGTWEEHDE